MSNIFAPVSSSEENTIKSKQTARTLAKQDYSITPNKLPQHILSFLFGFLLGFVILFVYYQFLPLSIIGGAIFGVVYIFIGAQNAIRKRRNKLRLQFKDMLEALSVAMRAGNPPAKALQSAREDLMLIYNESDDIITEIDIIIALFNNAVPLSESFHDFAQRSGLEDIESFASIYKTIEGKSSRADEIVRQTQSIIGDKMEIEMEIETLLTSAKNEMNIMTLMPIVILLILGYVGADFMGTIYTTIGGRIAATIGLIIFVISVSLGRKISSIKRLC
jgi:tight adherence protein B